MLISEVDDLRLSNLFLALPSGLFYERYHGFGEGYEPCVRNYSVCLRSRWQIIL